MFLILLKKEYSEKQFIPKISSKDNLKLEKNSIFYLIVMPFKKSFTFFVCI